MKKTICFAIFILFFAVAGYTSYVTGIYKDQGGDRMVVSEAGTVVVDGLLEVSTTGTASVDGAATIETGGSLAVDGALNIGSGGALAVAGTAAFTGTTNATLAARNATADVGMIWYCTDCCAGAPGFVFSNGTAYTRMDTLTAIATE